MGMFIDAFKQGQEATEMAKAANSEIDDVLAAMKNELSEATDKKLQIMIETPVMVKDFANLLFDKVTGKPSAPPSQNYWICATNPFAADRSLVRLAAFKRPYEGYPCSIEYGNREVRCGDAVALAAELNAMLRNAWIAGELQKVVNREPPPPSFSQN